MKDKEPFLLKRDWNNGVLGDKSSSSDEESQVSTVLRIPILSRLFLLQAYTSVSFMFVLFENKLCVSVFLVTIKTSPRLWNLTILKFFLLTTLRTKILRLWLHFNASDIFPFLYTCCGESSSFSIFLNQWIYKKPPLNQTKSLQSNSPLF